MSLFSNLPALLAQQQSTWVKSLLFLGIVLLVFVLPFVVGQMLANLVRMRDYGWRIGLIIASLAVGILILARSWDSEAGTFDIPLGVDLKGGVILVYEVDTEATSGQGESGVPQMDDLVQALTNRINPSGTKEIVIRPYGERQVEIIVPEVDPIEVEHIKRLISTAGSLEFRIVANTEDHKDIIELADAMAESNDPARRLSKRVMRGDEMVGFWARAAQEKLRAGQLAGNILRNATTGKRLEMQSLKPIEGDELLADFLERNNLTGIDILVATDDGVNVTGEHLGAISASVTELLAPCVNFRMQGQGVQKFRFLTSQNLPNMDTTPPFYRHLGIILDERLLTFPRLITTISDSGQITGNFTQEEVDFLVGILRSGRLPATLKKEPISENQIGSMLGNDTINKGKWAIGISLAAVLLFVLVYYRFAGIVACLALLTNLLLILAMMLLLNAPLTLPGLAGLVLTIGMSVDANVLIFERIREEMLRGAALRMAIRNGFARATTTIVDANVTTLITAMVLYAIGTDQVRGFAVTLILGILMSMYTAIFCSRVVFDIAERRRWISQLKMMRIVGATNLDFLGKRRLAIAMSICLIVVGLVAVGVRGKSIFDIDFNGGVSATMVLEETMTPAEVRRRIGDRFATLDRTVQFSVNTVDVESRPADTVYKIDADLTDVATLEEHLMAAFRDGQESLLLSYQMDFDDVEQVTRVLGQSPTDEPGDDEPGDDEPGDDEPGDAGPSVTEEPAAESSQESETDETQPADDATSDSTEEASAPANPAANDSGYLRTDLPAGNLLAMASPLLQDEPQNEPQDPPAEQQPAAEAAGSELTESAVTEQPGDGSEPVEPPATAPAADQDVEPSSQANGADDAQPAAVSPDASDTQPQETVSEIRTVAHLKFGDPINAPTLLETIREAAREADRPVSDVVVDTDKIFDWDQESAAPAEEWYVSMVGDRTNTQQILQQMKQRLADTPIWPSSSKIGGKVAGDTRRLAIAALLTSLLGIIAYIWIRFQRVVFGLAAVVALVHDVTMTVGAIAVSAWLAKPFGFLLIEDFRISLPIVAAFLTIIGYSLNDTIVVFDRIREVRGKSLNLTADMINLSINQTLSRTLLTSLTTLIVVLILYTMGGQGIHGFAFALVIGVLVGTYSSIFIASPTLLWLFGRRSTAAAAAKKS